MFFNNYVLNHCVYGLWRKGDGEELREEPRYCLKETELSWRFYSTKFCNEKISKNRMKVPLRICNIEGRGGTELGVKGNHLGSDLF